MFIYYACTLYIHARINNIIIRFLIKYTKDSPITRNNHTLKLTIHNLPKKKNKEEVAKRDVKLLEMDLGN